jgi:hypothetical protein
VIDLLRFGNFKLLALLAALIAWQWQGARAGRKAWLITVLFSTELIVEIGAAWMALHGQWNHWLYNVYFPIEFGLLTAFAYYQWQDRRYVVGLAVGAAIFSVVYTVEAISAFKHQQLTYTSYITESLLIIAFGSVLLIRTALTSERSPLHYPMFWLLFSTVFFFGGMLPLMGLLDVMSQRNPALWNKLFLINDILFQLRFGLVAVPLLILPRKAKGS